MQFCVSQQKLHYYDFMCHCFLLFVLDALAVVEFERSVMFRGVNGFFLNLTKCKIIQSSILIESCHLARLDQIQNIVFG